MSVSEVYADVCARFGLKLNPDVLDILRETKERDVTLKMTGSYLRRVQKLNDDDIRAVAACLENERGFTGLDLRYNEISDEGARHIARLLQEENSALRSLDLMCNNIQTNGAEGLAKSLHNNKGLLSIRMTGNKIGNRGGMFFASMLQTNNTLQKLDLAYCDLDTQSLIAFAIALHRNTSLRSLNISRPLLFSHQEETVVHLSGLLSVNQTLRELHLGMMAMTDTGVERLTEGLRVNRGLRYLDLSCNRVTRDGAQSLAEALRWNTTLQILDLASNRIEDEGAVSLSEALRLPTCGLRALSITSNNIGSVGVLAIAQAMKVNSALTHIYIWGNHLHDPVSQAFSELIVSGRLCPHHTDVSAYEVDGQVCLAEVFHGLRKHYYWSPSQGPDMCPAANAALDLVSTEPTDPSPLPAEDLVLCPEPLHIPIPDASHIPSPDPVPSPGGSLHSSVPRPEPSPVGL